MTELRTLDDLWSFNNSTSEKQVEVEELKQEAIKWVKQLGTPDNENYYGTVEDWIKHFFNLTPQDLNNEEKEYIKECEEGRI